MDCLEKQIAEMDSSLVIRQIKHGDLTQFQLNNLLNRAAMIGSYELARLTLEYGADIHNGKDIPICYASSGGSLKLIKLLIDYGANIHTQSSAPVIICSGSKSPDALTMMIEAGANVHVSRNITLTKAVISGCVKSAQLLINSGVCVASNSHKTLVEAIRLGNKECINILMKWYRENNNSHRFTQMIRQYR